MRRQIEKALNRFDKMSPRDQEGLRAILNRYVEGEIELAEAYADLLDEEIIPMPSRCGLTEKEMVTGVGEAELKKYIVSKIR